MASREATASFRGHCNLGFALNQHRCLFRCTGHHLLMAIQQKATLHLALMLKKYSWIFRADKKGPSDHNFIQPFLRQLSEMTPTRKATPMFHMAKAATISIT
jgi:hypothetical protein